MNLAQQIEIAQARNEQALTAQIASPQLEVDPRLLNRFVGWCNQRGVRCTPAVVAAYVQSEYSSGTAPEEILTSLASIEAWETNGGRANPCATPAARAALADILKVDPPRSWNKFEQGIFISLPIEAQRVIWRHAKIDSDAVRKAQNQAAQLRKELAELETPNSKESDEHAS